MLAVMGDVATLDQFVDGRPHLADGRLEALELRIDVLGDEVLHDDPGLVQNHVAEGDPVGERDAPLVHRPMQRGVGIGRRERLELARGDHLGEHHGGRLERLDLFFRVHPIGAVLHDEDAERVAGTQQRHAQERVIDLLAGLRLVGEGRMRLASERESGSAVDAIRPTTLAGAWW